MSDPGTLRTRFSSDGLFADLPPDRAARAWRELCAERFGHVEIEARDDARFFGFMDSLSLDAGVTIGQGALNVKRIARTVATVRARPDDRMTLMINTTGTRNVIRHLGRELQYEHGSATLFSHVHPSEFLDVPPGPVLQIVMDHQRLSSRVPHLEDRLAVEARGNSDTLRLLINYSQLLLEDEQGFTKGLAELAAAHLVDLAALVLGADRDFAVHAHERGVRAARLASVLHIIKENFGDAGLSAAIIAARLGVTPRYVHLLLDESGKNFSQHLKERRLVAARDMLADLRKLNMKIADVACAVGFSDVAHFNRSFRARYGMTPSDVRAHAILNDVVLR
jgi:AraC-like DNA-binding protein